MIFLALGLILMIIAGYQDFKTRKPFIIIPALISIGLAVNIITALLIGILGYITLYHLPNKVNKTFGKADIFLLISLVLLLIMAQSMIFTQIILFACIISILLNYLYIKQNPNKLLPFVGLFITSFFISVFIDVMLSTLTVI